MPINKSPTREKIPLHVVKGPLDPSLSVRMSDPMGYKDDSKDSAERLHFRSHLGVRTAAAGDNHRRVVNHDPITDPVYKLKRLGQEDLGLESGEAGIVLNEELSGIGQDKSSALACRWLSTQYHPVGRGIVLHLLSRTKGVHSGSYLLRFPEALVPGDPSQGAVSDSYSLVCKDLLDPNPVSPTP